MAKVDVMGMGMLKAQSMLKRQGRARQGRECGQSGNSSNTVMKDNCCQSAAEHISRRGRI